MDQVDTNFYPQNLRKASLLFLLINIWCTLEIGAAQFRSPL